MSNVTDASFLHIGIVILLSFSLSEGIVKKLGNNLITVVGKIMGLILTIMGTGMVIDGIKIAFNIQV